MVPRRPHAARVALALVFSFAASPAGAQCLEWRPGFHHGGANDAVRALCVYDDGGGARVYAGGWFTEVDGAEAERLAVWDPGAGRWDPLPGSNSRIYALAVYDDGDGPGLYAAGIFTQIGGTAAFNIARWDGARWSPLGSGVSPGLDVRALAVYDDGSGAALYAGGFFSTAGGAPANRIAKWDGTGWSALGSGLSSVCDALAVYDDGSGPVLVAGGRFTSAGGVPASRVAAWDGTSWSALGPGVNGDVHALASWDDGSGPKLYVGGDFTAAGGAPADRIARFDGSSWAALPGNPVWNVRALAAFDGPGGARLAVGGLVPDAALGALPGVALWDGAGWSTQGTGMLRYGDAGEVNALAAFDSGGGTELFVGGLFDAVDGLRSENLARFDGAAWRATPGDGLDDVAPFSVQLDALLSFDDGSGPALFATGRFRWAGPREVNGVARWDGVTWHPMAGGLSLRGDALAVHDDGGGARLHVAGRFGSAGATPAASVARWDGSGWSALGSGLEIDLGTGATPGDVLALAPFPSGAGAELVAGGSFEQSGATPLQNLARWDGAAWHDLGGGADGLVRALAVFDDGGGPALFAGGSFTAVGGGLPALRLARWDGTSWSEVGGGLDGAVHALFVFDDGGGPALYVGGAFTQANGGATAVARVARWDGSAWTALGGGFDGEVRALGAHDDGAGPALFAGGSFAAADGLPAPGLARWDGAAWSGVGGGTSGTVRALASFDAGGASTASLVVGGALSSAGGLPARGVAEWRACPSTGDAYCSGDGSGASCPCGNSGDAGRGCANGSFAAGCALIGTGRARVGADTLEFVVSQAAPGQPGLFFQGDEALAGGAGLPFGDGLRCAGVEVVRLEVVFADGAGGAASSVAIAAIGGPAPGETKRYQFWYRDPLLSPCGTGFNLSNGLELSWSP